MATQRKLEIDPEIYQRARHYVEEQLDVMRKCGSAPILTPEQYENLVYDCALPAQVIKNWNSKTEPICAICKRPKSEWFPGCKAEYESA